VQNYRDRAGGANNAWKKTLSVALMKENFYVVLGHRKNCAKMIVDERHIDPELFSMNFACDTSVCKGACCTFPGGSGAPLLAEEISQVEECFSIVAHYLPAPHRDIVERYGLWERDGDGYALRCHNGRACIFVMYCGDIAVCALQYAHARGEIDFIKPQSCHLFPIRLRGSNRDLLMFEHFSECEHAHEHGRRHDISVIAFLRSAIVRVFGNDFYEHLHAASRRHSLQ
jgi:hypothetical protein